MTETEAVPALAALAHTQRLRAFRALVIAGPAGMMPSVLAQELGVARNALSFHLKELSHAGLVSIEQQGRNLIYRADYEQMNSLLSYLTDHCCQGAECVLDAAAPCRVYNALFICTGNSARSILAEGLLNGLAQGRFVAYSAGSQPKGEVHAMALATLAKLGMPCAGYRSKGWDEFARPEAPHFDFIFTVCDNAAAEVCPVWPGKPVSAHWGVPDPAAVAGSDEQKLKAFQETARLLKRRIELFLSLPVDRLDAMSLQKQLQGIGKA